MLDVALLDVVELLLAGLVGLPRSLLEEVAELVGLFEHVERHFERRVLELDDEVDEEFVLVLADGELLPDAPELLCHPVGHDRHVLEVVHKPPDVANFVGEAAGQPELSPTSTLLVLVDEGERDKLGDGWISVLLYLYLSAFRHLLYESESIVGARGATIHERVITVVDEVEEATCRPHVALEGVFLVL